MLPFHVGLVQQLRKFGPTVILCEGESHLIGHLQAIYYRSRYDRSAALIHWCYIELPGRSRKEGWLAAAVNAYFRKYFSAFLVYSSFSKERLVERGEDPRKVFVATNVGDVEKYLAQSDAIKKTKAELRTALGLPEGFTVLYVGTLSENKRPEILLDVAQHVREDAYSFVLVGAGEL